MTVELLTARLRLRRWRDDDEAPMMAINRDADVTRYLNRPIDERSVELFHGQIADHWDRHGFGPWAVEPLAGGGLIGFVGVGYPGFLPAVAHRPELGWRLATRTWGGGYATEAAVAARDDALGRLALPSLISIIHPDNVRSQRVAEKLGMTIGAQIHNPVLGHAVDVWETGSE
ncbi:MAG TPA: GNAT family N-acetyltransferase [Solirubrobacteraceae bacterium]|nr:GNAT family N-acetyltransferase [Solirubrobacteraceae bacterium]